jgi:mono/diheme cytochrome c family protein
VTAGRGALGALVLAAAGLAAFVASGQPPKPRPGDTEWVVPAEEKARIPPFPSTPDGIVRGRALYQKHCATCHGETGHGDGPMAKLHTQRTSKAPYDLTDGDVQGSMTDGEVFWKVSAGYRKGSQVIMPAFKTLVPDPEDRWKIVHFVRSLGPAAHGAGR